MRLALPEVQRSVLESSGRFSLNHSFDGIDDIQHPTLQVAQCREDVVMVAGVDVSQDIDDRPDYVHCRAKQPSLRVAPFRDFCHACK